MNFYVLVAEKMRPQALQTLAPGLFKRLRDLIRSNNMNTLTICGVYRCLAIFGSRHPILVLNDSDVVAKMFEDLSTVSKSLISVKFRRESWKISLFFLNLNPKISNFDNFSVS